MYFLATCICRKPHFQHIRASKKCALRSIEIHARVVFSEKAISRDGLGLHCTEAISANWLIPKSRTRSLNWWALCAVDINSDEHQATQHLLLLMSSSDNEQTAATSTQHIKSFFLILFVTRDKNGCSRTLKVKVQNQRNHKCKWEVLGDKYNLICFKRELDNLVKQKWH